MYVVPLEYFPAERLGRCAPRLAHVRCVRTVGVRVGHVVQMGHVGQLEVLEEGAAHRAQGFRGAPLHRSRSVRPRAAAGCLGVGVLGRVVLRKKRGPDESWPLAPIALDLPDRGASQRRTERPRAVKRVPQGGGVLPTRAVGVVACESPKPNP